MIENGWSNRRRWKGEVENPMGNFNQFLTFYHQLSLSRPIHSFAYPAFVYPMASPSALPTVHQLLDRVSQLLQRSSQTEAETVFMTLQCLELKGKIEQTKVAVVEERMKQLVCADKIAYLKNTAAPRQSSSKETRS